MKAQETLDEGKRDQKQEINLLPRFKEMRLNLGSVQFLEFLEFVKLLDFELLRDPLRVRLTNLPGIL